MGEKYWWHPPVYSMRRSLSRHLLDVRKFPRLVEQRLLRTVEAGEHFEMAIRVGWHPVGFSGLSGRAEEDVRRTIVVLLQPRGLRSAANPFAFAYERMGVTVIDGHRPILCYRRVRGHLQAIGVLAFERLAILVVAGQEIILRLSEMFGAEESQRVDRAARIEWIRIGYPPVAHHVVDHFLGRGKNQRPPS